MLQLRVIFTELFVSLLSLFTDAREGSWQYIKSTKNDLVVQGTTWFYHEKAHQFVLARESLCTYKFLYQ